MPEHLRGGTRRIVGGNGETAAKVLMLTTFDLDEYVYDALRAGTGGRRVIASGR
jgi:hypothetical protein